MKFLKTVKFRLTVWYLLTMLIALLVFGMVAFFIMSHDLNQNLDDSLRARIAQLRSQIDVKDGQVQLSEQVGEIVWVYSTDGILINSFGPDVDVNISELANEVSWGKSHYLTTETSARQELRLYGDIIFNKNLRMVVIVGWPTTEISSLLGSFRNVLVASGAFVIILVGVGAVILSSSVMRPIEHITKTAQEISDKDLSRRVAVGRAEDEMGQLAQTLNHTFARLEQAFDRERQFTADASHELRTPLSIIQAESTLTLNKGRSPEEYQRSLALVSYEASYMKEIISKLLFLARSNDKEYLTLERINIRDFLTDLSSEMEVLSHDKELHCKLGPFDDAFINGDRVRLRQLFLNLWDNAIRYTPSGGSISSWTTRNGKTVNVSIADTGVGIAEEHLPHIFERFYRVDKARSRALGGSGLGLAIAKNIVEAHHGNIEVQSQPGKGTTFSVTLPLDSGLVIQSRLT